MTTVAIINGPNLNLLGKREPNTYGNLDLEAIQSKIRAQIPANIELCFFQSNHEGAIIDQIHAMNEGADGLVINPAAYSHNSIAIADALAAIKIPAIEVHLSNIAARESFRQVSLTASTCRGSISGLGWRGYVWAIKEILEIKNDT